MAFPSSYDTFLGTTAQGTSLLSSPDHSLDHRTLGSAAAALELKIGVGVSTPTVNKILIGSGVGTATWTTEWDNATLGTPQINNGTVANSLVGTSTITGGTISSIQITRKTLGSATATGTVSGTITLDLSTATRFLVNLPNSAGSVTLAVSNVVANQPFITEILQGTAGLGTIGWFTTIRWPNNAPGVLTTTTSKKDTFGFVPTSGTTFDAYLIGQNL